MASEFESAFRQLLKSVVQEVVRELSIERGLHDRPSVPSPKQADESISLLRSREAAKRLQVSERHLQKLTQSGTIPCVRVGQCVRYSVETIQNWIRDTESQTMDESMHGNQSDVSVKVAEPRKKTKTAVRPPSETKSSVKKLKRDSLRRAKDQPTQVQSGKSLGISGEYRVSPFSLLLEEMGIPRSVVPNITNGELRRIAEVDIPTLHRWSYLGGELPEIALKKLRDHFAAYQTRPSETSE